jgi:hypothetical protein
MIKPEAARLNIEKTWPLETPNDDSAVQIMFRVYPDRNKIRAIWLGLKNYYDFSINLETDEQTPYKKFQYKRNDGYKSTSAHRFRLGTNCQDKMFRKNDYSVYSNFFEIDDAAYMREFYILYN